jgi:hypothetical protein
MNTSIKEFLTDDAGAITVDWVVLTAACVALGLGTITLVSGSIRDNSMEASAIMETYEIDGEFDTEAEIAALQQAANASLTPTP